MTKRAGRAGGASAQARPAQQQAGKAEAIIARAPWPRARVARCPAYATLSLSPLSSLRLASRKEQQLHLHRRHRCHRRYIAFGAQTSPARCPKRCKEQKGFRFKIYSCIQMYIYIDIDIDIDIYIASITPSHVRPSRVRHSHARRSPLTFKR